MTEALKAGHRVTLNSVGLFADGAAVKQAGEETFRLAKLYVDDMITVSTDEICAAIKDCFNDTRSILEPAGALSIAGLKKYVLRNQIQGKT
jgi:threonine dehydratase